jgi:hypothetical protein
MQAIIEVPDGLPKELIAKRIKEIEERLKKDAESMKMKNTVHNIFTGNSDPWTNPSIDIPAIDTDREDGSINHDYYIYGIPKR